MKEEKTPVIPATPNPKSMGEIKELIHKHQIGVDSKSRARELLIEGFDNIKSRVEYNNKLREADNITIDIEKTGGWIHNLVRDTVGGTINSTRQIIMWEINGETIEFDPYSGSVENAK